MLRRLSSGEQGFEKRVSQPIPPEKFSLPQFGNAQHPNLDEKKYVEIGADAGVHAYQRDMITFLKRRVTHFFPHFEDNGCVPTFAQWCLD